MQRIAALLSAAFILPALAGFNYPECPDYMPSEFRYRKLISRLSDPTLREPVRMDFDYRGEGRTDIYFAERHGKIKRWDAVKNEMTVLGELEVFSDDSTRPDAEGSETGINGLALDPDFKENQRLYVFYSPYRDTVYRLSRFTLKDGKMDMGSEKILLDIPEGRRHVSAITIGGGAMEWDADGNLYIAVGANSEQFPSVDERIRKRSAEASSANMADLRGAILRIHPDESEKGYSVPKGNLAEYWAAELEKDGRSALARTYADT
ncbi:MAG TPA: PQQ-dependent sugar dehydrogenase, partial [Fibrobacteria bacterium]|nr:PQQ-dependent sugar dehydrogenase [Fibrobacteria bacterium]